ncbi:hypothetical protein [Natronorarus salvus]|uniref:hypothetical protein n=1 Tax=Natronorarus salvus TaxID=3117733 RepID=UPI002F26AE8B
MRDGTIMLVGLAVAGVLSVSVGVSAFLYAPPVNFPGEWAWLNEWGEIGVAAAAGFFAFVFTLVITQFVLVAKGFNEFDDMEGF